MESKDNKQNLTELFRIIKERIDNEIKESGFVGHSSEMGTTREELLKDFLVSLLPNFFKYGRGTIIDHLGKRSLQQDVIIYSPYMNTLTEKSKTFLLDSVCATIEVKSFLNKNELESCLKNIQSVKALNKINPKLNKIQCNIFAYDSDSAESILKNLKEIKNNLKLREEELFDNLCIHGKCLITKNALLKSLSKPKDKYEYLNMEIGELALPYFLDSMLNSMEIPNRPLPLFVKYLGNFKFGGDEWKLN